MKNIKDKRTRRLYGRNFRKEFFGGFKSTNVKGLTKKKKKKVCKKTKHKKK